MDFKELSRITDGLTNTQVQNIIGRSEDEEIDTGAATEEHEAEEHQILSALRKQGAGSPREGFQYITRKALWQVMEKFHYQFEGVGDDENELIFHNNEKDITCYVYLYDDLGTKVKIHNISIM